MKKNAVMTRCSSLKWPPVQNTNNLKSGLLILKTTNIEYVLLNSLQSAYAYVCLSYVTDK